MCRRETNRTMNQQLKIWSSLHFQNKHIIRSVLRKFGEFVKKKVSKHILEQVLCENTQNMFWIKI